MANVRIVLQPPPNVDFVVGYPGIPPGARDRPQAAVKGAVEVRVGPAGAKAKWVRVELKKIETLPGGGQANAYYDHVGPSPVTLWQSGEDYSVLQSQDLPFLIRIPESMPPSIALDRGAGIRYELVATVCTLGKKGFFRRRKTAILSQATTIIIDKHELHSTWPVYSQHESRSVFQDGVHLAVERDRTCYGPGDRVSVMAILKSDVIHPVVLRGFEFTLRETTSFRAGPQASSKRSGPQTKTANIGEQKVPLSVTLYNGNQHKAELGCIIPNTHTTTTLNAARHIDINYVIIVRAWIGQMQSVTMELPVIVSNWPRNVSEEAIRRIGHAPSLCGALPSSSTAIVPIATSVARPRTADSTNPVNDIGPARVQPTLSIQYTAPSALNGTANAQPDVDEHGVLGNRPKVAGTIDHPGYGPAHRSNSRVGLGGIQENVVLGAEGGLGVAEPRARRRWPSANAQNRLTITNISEKDAEDGITPQAMPTPRERATQRVWPTAENEKTKLYENAIKRVQEVQGAAALANATTASDVPTSTTTATPKKTSPWPTAESEKVRLYEHAQATVKRTQAFGVASPSTHSRSSSEANSLSLRDKQSSSTVVPGPAMSVGAAMYQHAVSSMSNNRAGSPNNLATTPSPPPSRVPHYPSAEQEKEALKRYHEAKLAVDRNQNMQYSGAGSSTEGAIPASYDDLSDMPPPFESSGSSSRPDYLNEKERLRRQYEAQDAAALAAQGQEQERDRTDAPAYVGPPAPPPESSGLSEKEILRRRLEEQDRVAQLLQQQQQQQQQHPHPYEEHVQRMPSRVSPPRANSTRAPPVPPTVNGFHPLTAAEEKARLRAKYEAEEQQQHETPNGHIEDELLSRHPYATATPKTETPPPLLPRPPVEYIQETREADMRGQYYENVNVNAMHMGLVSSALDNLTPGGAPRMASPVVHPRVGGSVDMRPFSPFNGAGLGYDLRAAIASPAPVRGHMTSPPPPGAYY